MVITIIMVLVGMLVAALGMLSRQRKRVETLNEMKQLEIAITDYLQTYNQLGLLPDSSDFVNSPWTFLGRNPMAMGNVPYTGDMLMKYLASGGVNGPWTAGTQATADQILDAYMMADFSNHFVWYVVNSTNTTTGRTNTDKVYIRSTCGTPTITSDDLIVRLTVSTGIWDNIKYQDSLQDTPAPSW